ncbi:MAG: ABC transporter substrate-binding protein, partial [Halobacteriaceae archaeon]
MSDGGRDSEALDSRRIQAAVTRRDVLLGGATATLAGLAGCSGQSGEQSTTTTSTTTTTTESGGTEGTTTSTQAERVDQTLVSHMWSVPTEVQFNPWNPQQQSGHLNNHLFLSLAKYNGVAREWGKEIAEDWTYSPDEQTFEVTISGDYKWHDGSPVTTKDVAVGNRIDEYFGATMWNYVDSIDVPDDTTIRYNLSGSVNKNLLFNSILPGEIRTRESEYGEWLQKFRDAEGDDSKVDEVRTNLTSYSQDEAVGNNVWKVEQLSKQAARLGIWDEQPGAGKINYPTLRLLFQNSNKKNWLA